jgi:hypothetical protein
MFNDLVNKEATGPLPTIVEKNPQSIPLRAGKAFPLFHAPPLLCSFSSVRHGIGGTSMLTN